MGTVWTCRAVLTLGLAVISAGAVAAPALADIFVVGTGNSRATAVAAGERECVFKGYNAREVLSVWSYVDGQGATMFKARVRCIG